MKEGDRGGRDGATSLSSALLNGGGRQRFEVELNPGETTIVSWKKLTKDANKTASNSLPLPSHVPAPPMPLAVAVNQALDRHNAPSGEPAEKEANDAYHGSRFGAVIEKIEHLYMGKNSSDEEDLNDVVPDDDEYDTEDSFIDDTELDDYFQVDDSQIKHDGFFVNRGKLERATVSQNEPIDLTSPQRKNRKKDLEIVNGGNDSGQLNIQKIKNNEVEKVVEKNTDKQKGVICQPEDNDGSKVKNGNPSSVTPLKWTNDNSSHVQSSSHSGILINKSEELNQLVLMREKNVNCEQLEVKATETTQQATLKNQFMVRKEGSKSNTKSKSANLEKAIRDLENTVVESRPPSRRATYGHTSSPAVKKRMPPEIKHKLAKVARLADATHGKISKELLNRLMSIVGHLIQLRTLKRNLVNMVNMGLSAKREKDARMQQLKKEIEEMVKIRAPMMISKTTELQQVVGETYDFQESGTKEKEILKRRITMDNALEEKICILYDLLVDGLDEDLGPPVRKLYAELAEMWPQGLMDKSGIRETICRTKDRKKALNRNKLWKSGENYFRH